MKKYNNQTGCYKIDIYVNGVYSCSTDQSKTCKAAVKKYCDKFGAVENLKITARFYRF